MLVKWVLKNILASNPNTPPINTTDPIKTTDDPEESYPDYKGHLDGLNGNVFYGWVFDANIPQKAIKVGIFEDDNFLHEAHAAIKRPDLRTMGIDHCEHGFEFSFPDERLVNIKEKGSIISVRVLETYPFEVGQQTFGSAVSIKSNIQKLQKSAFVDAQNIEEIVSKKKSKGLKERKIDLTFFDAIFYKTPLETTKKQYELSPFGAFLTSKYELDIFSSSNSEQNYADFFNWYLTQYAPQLDKNFRVPLKSNELEWLNYCVPIGGQKFALSRFHWMVISKHHQKFYALDLSSTSSYLDTIFQWVINDCVSLRLEDCLIPVSYVQALNAFPDGTIESDFSLNNLAMQFGFLQEKEWGYNKKYTFDRIILYTILVMRSFESPHLINFIPEDVLFQLFKKTVSEEAPFNKAIQFIGCQNINIKNLDQFYGYFENNKKYDIKCKKYMHIIEGLGRADTNSTGLLHALKDEVDVQVIGPFSKTSGLGQAARLSAKALQKTSCSLNFVDYTFGSPSQNTTEGLPPLSNFKKASINIIHINCESIPELFTFFPGVFKKSYNIGYVFWELDSPAKCHFLAVDLLDEIWTASDYVKDCYKFCQNVTLTKVGMGYQPEPHSDVNLSRIDIRQKLQIPIQNFVFLCTFDAFSYVQRKNPLGVIKAFQKAFSNDINVSLLLKTQNQKNVMGIQRPEVWAEIEELIQTDDRIKIIDEVLSSSEVTALVLGSDCYVSLHRSEGWGFGMIEAMALKIPVLCTAYSGNMEFCNDKTAWLVDFELVQTPRNDYVFVDEAHKWADPNIEHAAQQMQDLYRSPKIRQNKSDAALRLISTLWSLETLSTRYQNEIFRILSESKSKTLNNP